MSRRGDSADGIDRRSVLAASAGAAAALWSGARELPAAEDSAAGAVPGAAASAEFDLAELSISELGAGLASGRWTSVALVARYRERIASVDRAPGGVNALAELDPEAEAVAAELDAERRAGRWRGELHGIPIVVKDNLNTAGRMATSAGSLALAESIAERDAFVVARLREAGAVILGKTNLSEWANFRSTRSTSGWSGRGGQVRNPYALDRSPCGSSSGSGAAAAASFAAGAVGTETDGSVICPAAMCGLVGMKPTVGRLSRGGIVPISHSQDTAGPMARGVEDAALLLAAMCGVDRRDEASAAMPADAAAESDFRRHFAPTALRGVRLGVVRGYFEPHPEIARQFEERLAVLRELGAELVDPVELKSRRELGDAEWTVLTYEFHRDLDLYLAALPERGQPCSLAALVDWNRAHAEREMPWFGQEIFEESLACGPLTDPKYLEALALCRRLSRDEGLDPLLGGDRACDALVSPTANPAFPIDWINGDAHGGSITEPSAVAGYPHLTVPAGFVHGLPWGLSFLGPAWSEARLLAYGEAFERAARARRPPTLAPTLPLSS